MNVSGGEIYGLAILVGVLTGVSAAIIVPYLTTRLRRSMVRHERRLTTCCRWVDARCAMSRASKDFVTLFRNLDGHDEHALDDQALRRAEQARATWLAACRAWDQATAQFLVWSDHPPLGGIIRQFEQPDAQAIRAAIGKRSCEVEQMFARLDELDALAVSTTRQLLREAPSWWWSRMRGAEAFLARIMDRWARPN